MGSKKKKPKRKPFGVQVFLNAEYAEDLGWASGVVSYPRWKQGHPDIKLSLGDCSRIISYDFTIDPDSGAPKEERIKKVQRLRRFMIAFCDAAEEALREAEQWPKKEGAI